MPRSGTTPRSTSAEKPVGCVTTARATDGCVRHLDRHVARLVRDAALLGLGRIEPAIARNALLRLAARNPDGAVGIEASWGGGGDAARLRLFARELGPDGSTWHAIRAATVHPGFGPWSSVKPRPDHTVWSRAAGEEARAVGADEALVTDATGHLVEGARSSLIVVLDDGRPRTPPLARGAQAGISREIALERIPELGEADVPLAALAGAREIVAVNAVRGARPIVSLDGRPVGDGRPGPWAARLAEALAAD